MSYLGAKTRKRIIEVHADLSPARPLTPARKPLAPATPCRPPLATKLSHTLAPSPAKGASSNKLSPVTPRSGTLKSLNHSDGARTQHVAHKRSPLRTKMASGKVTTPSRPRRRHLPPPKALRGETIVEVEIVRRFAKVSLDDGEASEDAEEASCSTAAETSSSSDDTFSVADTTHPSVASTDVEDLLACCVTDRIIPFDDLFRCAEFRSLLPGGDSAAAPVATKLGEASYSEVYTVGASHDDTAVVVKVVPLLGDAGAAVDVELPDCSEVGDVVREVEITKRMSGVPGGGFVNFLGTFVVEGRYPSELLAQWDAYDREVGSESVRPDVFGAGQRYALIVLGNGGVDLEHYTFELSRGWVQAAAVFWQVADALARAEEWTQFEHRDLHEGQVLVGPADEVDAPAPVANYLDTRATGVRATVIDFGLSRLNFPQRGAVHTPLPEEVYDGVGDQWDVYRAQRERVLAASSDGCAEAWAGFHPATNVLWLHYLAAHLLRSTRTLRKPTPRRGGAAPKTAAQIRTEVVRKRALEAWTMLTAVDAALAMPSTKGRATRGHPRADFISAQAVMAWGREQGWVA